MLEHTGKTFDQLWQERGDNNPAGRFGRAEELGALCAFVCSSQAGYITGQNLLIDGGAYPGTF
jgi:3-oxoacyl-[acyl-carrier protein] reductase